MSYPIQLLRSGADVQSIPVPVSVFLLSLEDQVLRVFLDALTVEDKGTQSLLPQPAFLHQSSHQAGAMVS